MYVIYVLVYFVLYVYNCMHKRTIKYLVSCILYLASARLHFFAVGLSQLTVSPAVLKTRCLVAVEYLVHMTVHRMYKIPGTKYSTASAKLHLFQ